MGDSDAQERENDESENERRQSYGDVNVNQSVSLWAGIQQEMATVNWLAASFPILNQLDQFSARESSIIRSDVTRSFVEISSSLERNSHLTQAPISRTRAGCTCRASPSAMRSAGDPAGSRLEASPLVRLGGAAQRAWEAVLASLHLLSSCHQPGKQYLESNRKSCQS